MGEAKRKEWAEENQAAAVEAQAEQGPPIRLADGSVAPGAEGPAAAGDAKRQARVEILPDGSAARLTFADGSRLEGEPENLVSWAEMVLRVALQCFAQRAKHFQGVMSQIQGEGPPPG